MRQLLRRLRFEFWLVLPLGAVVANGRASASNDLIAVAKTKLDAVHLAKYAALYAEFERAQKDEQLAIEAAEKADPLYRDARRGVAGADGGYEKAKLALENAEDTITKKWPGLMADYRQWRELYGNSLCKKRVKTFAADPAKRAWVLWSGRKTIKLFASAPKGALPPRVKQVLPKRDAKLTDNDLLAVLEKMSELPDDAHAELDRLEQKLAQVPLPRKEIAAFDEVNARRLGYTVYVQENTPDSVKRAGANVQRISNEMTTVWPAWGEAYQKTAGATGSASVRK
jgi:hypothetical protein